MELHMGTKGRGDVAFTFGNLKGFKETQRHRARIDMGRDRQKEKERATDMGKRCVYVHMYVCCCRYMRHNTKHT